MKTILFAAALCLGICQLSQAQNYGIDLIPKKLLPYAGAVVRTDETTITIKDNDNVTYHVKHAITVLNKNGADEAEIVLWHNKSRIIKSVKGIIYNEYGQPVSKFSESNFKDDNAYDGFSLFEDERVKYYNPPVTTYPYTVECEYDLRTNQSLNISPWFPVNSSGVSVEHSTYTLLCKPGTNIRYKETSYPDTVETATDDKGMKSYNWKLDNIPARRAEPYSPNKLNYITSVHIAPKDFIYEGVAGSYTNWNELGKWIYDKLLISRSQLSPETVQQMKDLTAGITDPKEKARKIYEYMQHKSRYVSIQIGIGGYQPFPAKEVDQLSYGDCKGLVNYTQALLKAVNIDSYYCVVKSGSEKASLKSDFASMDQADHIILCMPFKSDTTWLECTNKTIPFGYLGDFTDDRWVLACTPDGGKLLHTPKYAAPENKEEIKANFALNENGELKGDIVTTSRGSQYENEDGMLTESYQDQVKHTQKQYPINNMEIETLKFTADKNIKPVLTEQLKLTAHEYATTEDGKLHFMINSVNRISTTPHEIRNRVNPMYINRGYTDEDVITYTLPDGYHADRALLDVKLHKDFGNYIANITIKDNRLVYTRKMQLIDGTYTKEAYNELVDFYQAVVDADNYTITMVKNK
ncbi:DUF3857 domain-containing protein [Mucilaginibacter polytrichastri]|uniref:DUF3857 domain-containing protein n=1 Tax=Mucilaginibacter polytrichastri TaxID=1302689 RepID=A0A1Q5ZZ42_9SPHI|nr:DUF3857 domain-containing protein [Mucilaginibacter polytrichastri]OKS87033.1 hypothetical protein RG47T_2492 [Mucilaginibacter polytrichastri]SFS86251.1 Transglutaminase-like superfamily protein [Mucilaginibacter polytrichastri]